MSLVEVSVCGCVWVLRGETKCMCTDCVNTQTAIPVLAGRRAMSCVRLMAIRLHILSLLYHQSNTVFAVKLLRLNKRYCRVFSPSFPHDWIYHNYSAVNDRITTNVSFMTKYRYDIPEVTLIGKVEI